MQRNHVDPFRSGALIRKDSLWQQVSRGTFVLDERNVHSITTVNLRCIIISIVTCHMVFFLRVILEMTPNHGTSERTTFVLKDVIICEFFI